MNWLHEKDKFEESKNWIITNQSLDGYISWDEKGKCDPWDVLNGFLITLMMRV